ncbi:MAG: serine hydrolase domain-containing protein [Acidobacteriota bacterium]
MRKIILAVICTIVLAAPTALAQGTLSAAQKAKIDDAVAAVLASTGAPSASVAVVWDGAIAYERAYGSARLAPPTPATPLMRYSIGSVSKQFTATAILLLAEEKRLSLDDKVSRWLPDLTRADEVSIRQLLSMTAGYQDYYPQDYVFTAMRGPATSRTILDTWARKPLDFEPGTKWQYSNTNYVIAGLIVERASGVPLFEFLQKRIFTPLGMTSAKDIDVGPLGSGDAAGYIRNALGPLRLTPKEGSGWLFAAGQLAMTAHDLALWDISMIKQTLLQPSSYREMQTEVRVTNGVAVGYGLGVRVGSAGGRREISHGGAVSGYLTSNVVYPDDRAAIVVFSNIYPGAASPEGAIAQRIAAALKPVDPDATKALELAKSMFVGLQKGTIDRSLLSANASDYFTAEVLSDFASSLGPLGAPTEFVQTATNLRGGMTFRGFRVKCGGRVVEVTMRVLPDGRIEQYLVERAE